jgi:hypothetical protein
VWKSQNLYFDMMQQFDTKNRAYPSEEWKDAFVQLGDLLNVKTEKAVLV